jgi:DNA polymerase-3 subunit epsilon
VKFADTRRAGWDTETTGPDPTTARIVTAALIVRGGGREDLTMSWVINPGIPVPDEAAAIHGYTTARVQAEGQDPATALDEIATRLADAIKWSMPLVAFNTSFDWTVLHYDLLRNGLPTVAERAGLHPLPLVDPHVIDKQVQQRVRGKGMRKLAPTCERYGVVLEDWHTAEADALAALLIAEAQFDGRYARLAEAWDQGPAALFAAQQRWRADQQTSLASYFMGRGEYDTAADIRREWPLIPAAEAEGVAAS